MQGWDEFFGLSYYADFLSATVYLREYNHYWTFFRIGRRALLKDEARRFAQREMILWAAKNLAHLQFLTTGIKFVADDKNKPKKI